MRFISPRTARSYISALSPIHKLNSWQCVCNHFLVQKAIAGMTRRSRQPDTRQPITTDLPRRIVQILPAVCRSFYEASLFSEAYLLTFFSIFQGQWGSCRFSQQLVAAGTVTKGRVFCKRPVLYEGGHASLQTRPTRPWYTHCHPGSSSVYSMPSQSTQVVCLA